MSSVLPVSLLVNGQPRIQEHGRTYYKDWRYVYPYPCDDVCSHILIVSSSELIRSSVRK